ncbi:hypothetical protein BKA70DRAFT_1296764 [Coprinopsis sp. MPI-PUGE-AT-0042]|nr:hypothetical protein BKA70DRAFT_1296764 [Coprinopsis sp. MPI-PUGE-AT-0042]
MDHSLAAAVEDVPRELHILYATETGNSQDAADYIARQCRRIAFRCRVTSMDAYSVPDLISENLVIFVASTTGSGVEPRAMTELWNTLLRSDLPEDLFEDLPFAVFGLGDTSYESFNWAAKKLSRRMQSLGAEEIMERGEGDEQHPLGIDGALFPWTEKLLDVLVQMAPLVGDQATAPAIPPSRVVLESTAEDELKKTADSFTVDSRYYEATVKTNRRLTAEGWSQDVRHFEFEYEDEVRYEPGDVAVIHPVASQADVDSFLEVMDWTRIADEPVKIIPQMSDQSLPSHLPDVATLRTIFTRYLDFNGIPRRSFFQFLRYFTTDELEREKLDEFLSPEGSNELFDYVYKVRRTMYEVLTEFRNVRIPQDYIFDVFPPLRPRHFSIASSVSKHPRQIHLCVAIVKYRTKLKIPRKGVCTSYLALLKPGEKLRIGILKGLIRLPPDTQTPIICIGPGTGIAPMRAVLEERIFRGSEANTLYFGCRSESQDQHYGDEWKALHESSALMYRTAFSRDAPEGSRRPYVQDRILEDAQTIWRLVCNGGAWVYISGSSNKMPVAVKEAIAHAVQQHGGMSTEEAKTFVDSMVKEGRLVEECWS